MLIFPSRTGVGNQLPSLTGLSFVDGVLVTALQLMETLRNRDRQMASQIAQRLWLLTKWLIRFVCGKFTFKPLTYFYSSISLLLLIATQVLRPLNWNILTNTTLCVRLQVILVSKRLLRRFTIRLGRVFPEGELGRFSHKFIIPFKQFCAPWQPVCNNR